MDTTQQRNGAIDMFRGLTMFLMIIVNDFWKVADMPHWLEHFAVMEDGMGLSDFVYPMFLFAMGMSVPYALDKRAAKGCSLGSTVRHILSRTLALIVMGVFICNSDYGVSSIIGYGKGIYWLLMVVSFFLVWGVYPKESRLARPLKICGIAVLAFLAITYRSTDGGLFQALWWGILGQIGWMYLFCAAAYLLCGSKKWILAVLWGVFCLVNLSVAPMRDGGQLVGPNFLADFAAALQLGNGHSVIMALGGVLTTLAERRLQSRGSGAKLSVAAGAAMLLAIAAFLTHKGWIISKGLGTLPWVLYSSAASVAVYALLRLLEKHGLTHWFAPLRPCGTATLSVYMIPYFCLAVWVFVNPTIPAWFRSWAGVAGCVLFGLQCVGMAWILEKLKIKLKI
ncbi:MAG: DUF5009 domain-containing protein [Bacteroidales bacterium]|nr:DUF5009 domain-containing protein [Bacteroidales bacterium]